VLTRTASRCARSERGQVVVFFALLLPVIFAIGAIVIDVGNWYVHKRHLQTQVDAAALAGGVSMTGCSQDAAGINDQVEKAALKYSGDQTRGIAPVNGQLQVPNRAHAVLNSTTYWSLGTPTDGTGYDYTDVSTDPDAPKIGLPGRPCYNGYIDVKATEDNAPKLWGLLPFTTSPKTVARVELDEATEVAGVLPIGLPDNNPTYVAAIIVNMDVANWQTTPGAIVGSCFIDEPSTPPAGLAGFNVFQGQITGVNCGTGGVNFNGAADFGVFILTTLDSSQPSLTGSLDDICGQSPVPAGQLECFAYDDSGQELSFIHSYSDAQPATAAAPQLRQAPIVGGCNPDDLSRPYFNLNGGCAMTMDAKVDFFGVTGPSNDPTAKPSLGGVCADVKSNVGTVTYDGGTSSSWSITFTPPDSSTSTGRNPVNLTAVRYGVNGGGNCNNTVVFSKALGTAGAPYVADKDGNNGPVQYLTVDYAGQPANSINPPSPVNLDVTVGFTPPIVDAGLLDDPVVFRLGKFNTPSQTQALDCLASGAAGWRDRIVNGCSGFSINTRNGVCTLPWPNPDAPDCIDSEPGQFAVLNAYRDRFIPDGCAMDPNNWNQNGYTIPPPGDPRWAQLFVLDRKGFATSGKAITYPIRRFVNVYVTAASGFSCTGDDSADQPVGRNEVWGHVTTYSSDDPDATPNQTRCSFTDGGVCVPVLVK
jgi:Putative Flp pilus-assembly TadE/G-like